MSWFPEIMYDDSEQSITGHFPFIPVPEGQEMPKLLFVLESRETKETESGADGNEYPVVELDMHQYADMLVLKKNLSSEVFDQVRAALGLEPLAVAASKGEKISSIITKT